MNYLLSGTDLPRCAKVDGMTTDTGYQGSMQVTFTGVTFASNTRQHSEHRFNGFDRTGFCLSSPDSMHGMYLWFSERVV